MTGRQGQGFNFAQFTLVCIDEQLGSVQGVAFILAVLSLCRAARKPPRIERFGQCDAVDGHKLPPISWVEDEL